MVRLWGSWKYLGVLYKTIVLPSDTITITMVYCMVFIFISHCCECWYYIVCLCVYILYACCEIYRIYTMFIFLRIDTLVLNSELIYIFCTELIYIYSHVSASSSSLDCTVDSSTLFDCYHLNLWPLSYLFAYSLSSLSICLSFALMKSFLQTDDSLSSHMHK